MVNSTQKLHFSIGSQMGRVPLIAMFNDPLGVRAYNRDYGWKSDIKDCNNTAKYLFVQEICRYGNRIL